MAKSTGPENIGPENAISTLFAGQAVNRSAAITFGNNGNFPPSAAAEKQFAGATGGARGIRTRGTTDPGTCYRAATADALASG